LDSYNQQLINSSENTGIVVLSFRMQQPITDLHVLKGLEH